MTDHHTTARQAGLRRPRISDNAKTALAVAAIFLLYGIVGRMDYEDAVAMEAAQNGQQPQAVQVADAAPAVCK